MPTGRFANIEMHDIVGYKISACWVPCAGFQGNFFIYVLDVSPAQERFREPINAGVAGQPNRGTLHFNSTYSNYEFKNIDLISAKAGTTRRYRFRLFEFRYDPAMTCNSYTPIRLANHDPIRLHDRQLGQDFQYYLNGRAEHLLGYAARIANFERSVVRFSTLRNSENCFLEKMIDANDQINSRQVMADLRVSFSQGGYDVNAASLAMWHIDESYGTLNEQELPTLEDLAEFRPDNPAMAQMVKLRHKEHSNKELLDLDYRFDPIFRDGSAIETATFVFQPGYYKDVQIQ